MRKELGFTALRPIDEVRREQSSGGGWSIEVESTSSSPRCPHCGGASLNKHGIRLQKVVDTPHCGEPTSLLIHRRRWRCTECNQLFADPLPDIDDKRRATLRLVDHVRMRTRTHTFSEVGREIGMSDKSVRAIFDDYIEELAGKYSFVTPRYLGIGEVKIIGQYRAILTNVEKLAMYELLPSRNLADLRQYFAGLANPGAIEVVAADLWAPYSQAIQEFFPHAQIVADPLCVQRLANNAVLEVMEAMLKSLMQRDRLKVEGALPQLIKSASQLSQSESEQLSQILKSLPDLESAWDTKEKFLHCWTHDTRQDAELAFSNWAQGVPDPIRVYFKDPLHAWSNQSEQILNYFENRPALVYAESISRLTKSINSISRGYSFEVVRARMLYDERALNEGAKVDQIKKLNNEVDQHQSLIKNKTKEISRMDQSKSFKDENTEKLYGAYIPALCDDLESGEVK